MIALYHGKNVFLSLREARQQFNSAQEKLSNDGVSFDTKILDAISTPVNQVINELETPSLFVTAKVVLLKRPMQSPDHEDLVQYLIDTVTGDKLPEQVA